MLLQALEALKAALDRSPGSAEMEQKARQLRRLAAAQQNKENQGGNKQAHGVPAPAEPGSKFKFEGEEPASAVVGYISKPEAAFEERRGLQLLISTLMAFCSRALHDALTAANACLAVLTLSILCRQEPEEPKQLAAEPSSASDHRLPAVLADFQRNCIAHALERGTAEPSVYILHGAEPCHACVAECTSLTSSCSCTAKLPWVTPHARVLFEGTGRATAGC